jgi:hypothetical protein
MRAGEKLRLEARKIEAQGRSVARKILNLQGLLLLEQPIVHRPEFALGSRGFGRLGGALRMRMHVGQRKVTKGEAKIRTDLILDRFHDWIAFATDRALEIAVFEQRDQRVRPPLNVVPAWIGKR